MKSKYTKELLEKYVEESKNFSDLVRRLTKSKKVHGSMIAYIKSKLIYYNIDFNHFQGKSTPNKVNKEITKNEFIKFYLGKQPLKRTCSTKFKQYLFKLGFMENKCSKCGLTNFWNELPLMNQLDHINGDNSDNRLENLRILCPNCHSQTATYTGRNNKIIKKNKYFCIACNKGLTAKTKTGLCFECYNKLGNKTKRISKKWICTNCNKELKRKTKTGLCKECYDISQRIIQRPKIDILLKEIKEFNYTVVGKKYGVSDNTIKKWVKNLSK